jgi:hypothetical protein
LWPKWKLQRGLKTKVVGFRLDVCVETWRVLVGMVG